MIPTMTPQEFVRKWRLSEVKERSGAQEHFIDVCHMLGEPTPVQADPKGVWYTFEAGATKTAGGDGWADVWKRGFFGWEYKGKHKDLDAAYAQLLQYRESLENPPLLIISDMDRIVIHTNFMNTVKRVETLTLDDLLDPDRLELLRWAFTSPQRFNTGQATQVVTEKAARRFAELASILRKYGEEPEQVAHFLIRLLFCLFAEDTELLPEGLFSRLTGATYQKTNLFQRQLQTLFEQMATGGMFGVEEIRYFDGKLFDGARALELDSDSIQILREVCELDWANIEPSILGTLFERGLDPSKRAQLGAHYTGLEEILLVVEPVLMQPFREKWNVVRQQAYDLAARRDAATTTATRNKLNGALSAMLRGFARELGAVQILDPACGSGNFLYVALRQLLDLWKEVSVLGMRLGLPGMDPMQGEAPHPSQLHGIEINAYAHELAQTTIWIGYLQWRRDNGYGYAAEPILQPLDAIQQKDAILGRDAQGNPVQADWPAVDVIIGNPPFLGGSKIRSSLGDEYTETLFGLYGSHVPNFSDLVCYWFDQALHQMQSGKVKRVGLLATQGIRGGVNRRVLERIAEQGDIFMAWSDREWVLDGANVNVSFIGFSAEEQIEHWLNGERVDVINPDLTSSVDVTRAIKLYENEGICFMGPSAKAPFDIVQAMAEKMLSEPTNINGRPNLDVVRPVWSAIDITREPRNRWTIDFDHLEIEAASAYASPFEYVRKCVYPKRIQNRRKSYREKWWLYAEPRKEMREALKHLERYIATPGVAKHRLFVWAPVRVLCNQGTLVFAREDDYFFGMLHSKPHELWSLAQGTQLQSRPRYTPTTCFETFPLPWPPGSEPSEEDDARVRAIAEAARELVEKRQLWLHPEGVPEKELRKRTLTNLYNANPQWLVLAHQKLDEAVYDAYGWPHDISDLQILQRLLALNLERAELQEKS